MAHSRAVHEPDQPPPLRYAVLGPLDVSYDGESRTPTAPLPRALLAVLLLNAGQPLSTGRLTDELWPDDPPRSATAALQMYVSSLRRLLLPRPTGTRPDRSEPGDALGKDPGTAESARQHPVLRTAPGGYLMRVEPGQLDLARSRALAERGRRSLRLGRCAEAAAHLRRALALWRGPVLADVDGAGTLRHHVARLEAERLALLQDRIDVDLCLGRAQHTVGELSALCAENPLGEGLHQRLMVALSLTGERAGALEVYRRTHHRLVEELGIEPGPGLRSVQQAILTGARPPHPHHARSVGCASRQPSRRR